MSLTESLVKESIPLDLSWDAPSKLKSALRKPLYTKLVSELTKPKKRRLRHKQNAFMVQFEQQVLERERERERRECHL